VSELPLLYLLDTNVLVHLIRGDAVWVRVRATYQPLLIAQRPIISVVTAGELRSLALQFNWQAEKIDQMEFYLGYWKRVSIDDAEIIRAYAVIDAHCQRIGQPLGKNDVWIAATASVMGSRLLTTDKDFDRLDPLFLSRDWIDPNADAAGAVSS
jgi:tRNA(fMet)-specific endonuclease VapC